LKRRFAEITDSQQAMAMLRKTKQRETESVQIYSERLLQVAEDAYPQTDEANSEVIQQQLVNAFGYGLCFDYLKMKVLREDPKTSEDAVQVTMKEQNLRKRFQLRKDDDIRDFDFRPFRPITRTDRQTETRREEPMEIDHYRSRQCLKCRQTGHLSRNCPQDRTRSDTRPVQDKKAYLDTPVLIGTKIKIVTDEVTKTDQDLIDLMTIDLHLHNNIINDLNPHRYMLKTIKYKTMALRHVNHNTNTYVGTATSQDILKDFVHTSIHPHNL